MEAKRLLDAVDYESMKIYLADAFAAVHRADMPTRDCENVCNLLVILDSIVEEEHKQESSKK